MYSTTERNDDLFDNENDIAVIGLDAKIAGADNVEEFWKCLFQGLDMIHEFPEERFEDANNISILRTNRSLGKRIEQYGYLNRIDMFDPDVFGISHKEAELMDPAQRLFLQSAWKAIEDSGNGGEQLKKSSTGVYIGVNNINNQYCATMDDQMDVATYGLSVSGNVNSVVASRISYYLDLKGPAVVFDTACSSSLVAAYFACQQLRMKEVSTAIVGGIRLTILPPQEFKQNFGIESSSGRTKSFDAKADGTGGGEGVIAMVLKTVKEARQNRDHIYAIIKGGSINQDGTSVGITAPNAAAQEAVIKQAWKDARIDPQTISYIECHATGTELGDPIEISGIERAFRSYTNKKQFCAVGSVKSNAGHLDSASGIAGLLKAVLMLKYKTILKSLHFYKPNPKINFIESPVYVNDTCMKWDTKGTIRRMGVSSFGISGTNCHLILEEVQNSSKSKMKVQHPYILSVSAKNRDVLVTYIRNYRDFLRKNSDCDFSDFCYTANVGRQQYNSRFIKVLKDKNEFLDMKIDKDYEEVYFNEFKVVEISNQKTGYITIQEQIEKTKQASLVLDQIKRIDDNAAYNKSLDTICDLYLTGAYIEWERLYDNSEVEKISIPTYPYNNRRYWHTVRPSKWIETDYKEALHPLVDRCVIDTYQMMVYEKVLSCKNSWELREHRINGEPVLPGAALIEMAMAVAKQIFSSSKIEFENLQYVTPLSCTMEEERLVNIIVQKENEQLAIKIVSMGPNNQWIIHLEVSVKKHRSNPENSVQIQEILSGLEEVVTESQIHKVEIASVDGIHWNNLEKMYVCENEIVFLLNTSKIAKQEKEKYVLYPPVLDSAINAGTYLVEGEYLPFSFRSAIIYKSLPERFYSIIHKKNSNQNQKDLISFDIRLCTEYGEEIASFTDYYIYRVENSKHFMEQLMLKNQLFHTVQWTSDQEPMLESEETLYHKRFIVFCRENQKTDELYKAFFGCSLVVVNIGDKRIKNSELSYQIRNEIEDYRWLMADLKNDHISEFIHFIGYDSTNIQVLHDLQQECAVLLKSTMQLIQVIVEQGYHEDYNLTLVTRYATKVINDDECINPMNQSLIGMGTSIESEYNNIHVRAVDFDDETELKMLYKELSTPKMQYSVAYRKGDRYQCEIRDVLYSEKVNKSTLRLDTHGVYVITGGLGGMGIAFTRKLIELEKDVHIVLLNRTYSKDEFKQMSPGSNTLLLDKKNVINSLWEEESDIDILKCDIADNDQTMKVFAYLRNKYGKINGVIHTAGVPGDGFLMNKDWTTFENVLRPKVYGTWLLNQMTQSDNLQFFILCSSMTAIFGALGQSDYAAANAYLDSFSYSRNLEGKDTLTIDWTGWKDSGMAVHNNQEANDAYTQFLTDEEGALALFYALKSKVKQMLIGVFHVDEIKKQNLDQKMKIQNQITNELAAGSETMIESDKYQLDLLIITGKSIDELSDIEKNVAKCWAKVLSTDEIDIYEKFFENGGNSLLALNLQKEINQYYDNVLTITDIFIYSSINDMAAYIDSVLHKEKHNGYLLQTVATDEDYNLLYEQIMRGEIDNII